MGRPDPVEDMECQVLLGLGGLDLEILGVVLIGGRDR